MLRPPSQSEPPTLLFDVDVEDLATLAMMGAQKGEELPDPKGCFRRQSGGGANEPRFEFFEEAPKKEPEAAPVDNEPEKKTDEPPPLLLRSFMWLKRRQMRERAQREAEEEEEHEPEPPPKPEPIMLAVQLAAQTARSIEWVRQDVAHLYGHFEELARRVDMLISEQRAQQALLQENSLLRQQHMNRQELASAIEAQERSVLFREIETVSQQQRRLLEQNDALLHALRSFATTATPMPTTPAGAGVEEEPLWFRAFGFGIPPPYHDEGVPVMPEGL